MIFDLFPGSSSPFQICLRTPGHLLLLFYQYQSSPWRGSFLIFLQVMPTNRHMKQDMIHTQKTLQQTKEQSLVGIQILRGQKHLFIAPHLPTVQHGLTSLVLSTAVCLSQVSVDTSPLPRKSMPSLLQQVMAREVHRTQGSVSQLFSQVLK